jgi:vesicle-associated membrane protein 7
MPIIYSLVGRGTTVLAEYATTTGNFTSVTRLILDKISPDVNEKRSYVYNRHIFHYIVEDGLVYLCMADEEMSRRIPFAFLIDIKGRWKSAYGDGGSTAMAYGMNEDFSKVLCKQMDFYSNDPSADRINKVKGEIDEVKNIMVTNIERVLERGERIELLVDKTDNLSLQANTFKKKSSQLKRAMWWKNMKLWLIIIFVLLLVIYFIVAAVCGGLALPDCTSSSPSPAPPPDGGTTTGEAGTTTGR